MLPVASHVEAPEAQPKDGAPPTFWRRTRKTLLRKYGEWRTYIWGTLILISWLLLTILLVWFLLFRKGDPAACARGAVCPTLKPKGDMRSYQYKTLASDIEVLNILDPAAVTSAYSVSVLAGSFDEPTRVPGLAHFCEHMVFLEARATQTPRATTATSARTTVIPTPTRPTRSPYTSPSCRAVLSPMA
jgi:hypothetical protein